MMDAAQFFDDCARRLRDLVDRAEAALARLGAKGLNWRPKPDSWSAAQILDHMFVANRFYIEPLRDAVARAPEGAAGEVRHTWFGKWLAKASGPSGNVATPKPMLPRQDTYESDVVQTWKDQTEDLARLIESAKSKDVGRIRIRNPLIKLFRMTLADCFLVLTEHTERHVRQIEDRAGEFAGVSARSE